MSTTESAAVRDYFEALPEPDAPPFPAPREGADPLVHELIIAMLAWNATPAQAAAAAQRLADLAVDDNELRICFPDEIAAALGPRYPHVEERAERLCRVLNAVFAEEHAMSLDALRDANKRDARAYIDALDGIVPYAAARLFLLGLGGHAFPVDDRALQALIEDEVLEDGLDVTAAAGRLERAFRAGEAEPAFRRLETALAARSTKPSTAVKRKRPAARSKTKRAPGRS